MFLSGGLAGAGARNVEGEQISAKAAQQTLHHRAQCNSAARFGNYPREMGRMAVLDAAG